MPSISLRTIREEHASLAAVLHSLRLMLDQGPGDEPAAFFDVMRAMLFYIDEFPERQHHPKESQWLFPKVAERSPQAVEARREFGRLSAKKKAAGKLTAEEEKRMHQIDMFINTADSDLSASDC